MSKYRVFSGPYFRVIGPEKTSLLDTFHGVMVVSHLKNRNCCRITLLKICKFCTWSYFPILLGTHRSCSPILVFDVIVLWIAISLSHMFYLAFAASNNLMTRADVNRWIYRRSHPDVFAGKGVLKITAKLLCNFIETTIRHGRSPVNLLHIFRTTSLKNTSGRLFL